MDSAREELHGEAETFTIIPGTDTVIEVWVTIDENDKITITTAGHQSATPPDWPLPFLRGVPARTAVPFATVGAGRTNRRVTETNS